MGVAMVEAGWSILDTETGELLRPHRSGYSWQTDLTHPPRIYTTRGRAESYAPEGCVAVRVLFELPEEDTI